MSPSHAGFTARIAVPMKKGKQESADTPVLVFAAEKDTIPRHKHIVKDHVRVARSPIEATLEGLPFTEVVRVDDLLYSLVVRRNRKSNGIVTLLRSESTSGKNNDFVHDHGKGNVHFAASDDNAIAFLFHNVKVHVRVCLFSGPLESLPFDIGLRTRPDQVVLLEVIRATPGSSCDTRSDPYSPDPLREKRH